MALLDSITFSFAGKNSAEFGLWIAFWSGENPEELSTGLNLDLVASEMNSIRHKRNLYGGIPTDVLTFTFGIFKSNLTDMTREESRIINNWLTSKDGYQILQFNGESDVSFNAICTEVTDYVFNGLNGKRVVFTCDSPYAYTRPVTRTYEIDSDQFQSGVQTIKLFNASETGICYPTIYITATSDTVELKNVEDDQSMIIDFTNLTDRYVCINCERLTITDSDGKLIPAYKLGWKNIDKIYWPRLLGGANHFDITGKCEMKIVCSFNRKEGSI